MGGGSIHIYIYIYREREIQTAGKSINIIMRTIEDLVGIVQHQRDIITEENQAQ